MPARTPAVQPYDPACIDAFEMAKETVIGIRATRNQKNLPPKEPVEIRIKTGYPEEMAPVVAKLACTGDIRFVSDFGEDNGVSFLVRTAEVFVVLSGLVDVAQELAKLEEQLQYQEDFLARVRAKLANENFVAHAPEKVVATERKKEADSLAKIESFRAQIKSLKEQQ